MHPRNIYQGPIDFDDLAKSYPPLSSKLVIKSKSSPSNIDYRDPEAQRTLTQALLHRDFGLNIDLPEDRLCPPVPNRLNYILWLQDIIESIREFCDSPNDRVHVIDIGTGASAIYPLLGCALNSLWNFTATEIDDKSIEYATRNVANNNLSQQICLVKVKPGGPILTPLLSDEDLRVDFTMCNPPFYSSQFEMSLSAESKEKEPWAVYTGSSSETITPGGESTFIKQMIRESIDIGIRCRWYTSMFGKLSTLEELVNYLKEYKIGNYAVTQFIQGSTRRWAIGWSFDLLRLPDEQARFTSLTVQYLMPPPNSFSHLTTSYFSPAVLMDAVKSLLSGIYDTSYYSFRKKDKSEGLIVNTRGNTWSRAARRKRALLDTDGLSSGTTSITDTVLFLWANAESPDCNARLYGRWLRGEDRMLYESLWSHIIRKLSP